MDAQIWKPLIPEFKEKTRQFYEGSFSQGDYKKFSGFYGSYAQRGGKANMLRLRMTAGQVTKDHMAFITSMLKKYNVPRMHFTTCQTIQLHDLQPDTVADIMEAALEAGIVTIGGGGDYPRNVMCPPLSGVEKGEYFDVSPYAKAAGEYVIQFIMAKKMPRKLKISFSNSPENTTHATYRDLGFAATPEGRFDVYSAGGLGTNPRFGVKVAQGVDPADVLYYIKAMWLTFLAYGNYDSRIKARTRYMQETLGGATQYAQAYQEKLKTVFESGENLKICINSKTDTSTAAKKGDGAPLLNNRRVLEQKQPGLYAVEWHPIGGSPQTDTFCKLYDTIRHMENVQMRLSPDETAYLVNLTATEAEQVLSITQDSANSLFEKSVSCIGASTCQVGVRDSQALLAACVQAVREAGLPDGVLPKIYISGCPSSCGTHQTAAIGFRGGVKKVDGKPQPAFILYVNGCQKQGEETMGREIGALLETKIPEFLVKLGKTVSESGMDYAAWSQKYPSKVDEIAKNYVS